MNGADWGIRRRWRCLRSGEHDFRLWELAGVDLSVDPPQDALKEDAHLAGANRHGAALEAGQVDILVIANDAPLALMVGSELVAQVAKTHGQVEVVADHPALEGLGGVGALLRYRTRG